MSALIRVAKVHHFYGSFISLIIISSSDLLSFLLKGKARKEYVKRTVNLPASFINLGK